jgi:hypothetical protein
MEVSDGSPVSEVAVRYGSSRQSVYPWRDKYAASGIGGYATQRAAADLDIPVASPSLDRRSAAAHTHDLRHAAVSL